MIMATKLPQEPKTPLERILYDADLMYLGLEKYRDIAQGLRKEITATQHYLSDSEWLDMQIDFMENHHYWTEFAQKQYAEVKARNLSNLRKYQVAL